MIEENAATEWEPEETAQPQAAPENVGIAELPVEPVQEQEAVLDEARVEQAAPVPVEAVLPPRRNPGKRIALIVAAVVVVLGLLAGGGYFGFRFMEDKALAEGKERTAAKDWAAAEAAYTRAITMQPAALMEHTHEAVLLRGETRYHQDKYDEAQADLSQSLAANPNLAAPHIYMAEMYKAQGKTDEALQEAGAAQKLDDSFGLPYMLQAEQLYKENQYAEAEKAAAAAIERDASMAAAYRISGSIHSWQLDQASALADLNKAIELNPEDTEALAVRAWVYLWLDKAEDAQKDVDRATELAPDAPWTLWAQAAVKNYHYDWKGANELADRAIELDDARPEFYALRGNTHYTTAGEKDALADFDQAMSLVPDFLPALGSKARLLAHQYSKEDQLPAAQKMIDLAPQSGEGHALKAGILLYKHDLEAALTEAKKAVELDPDLASSYILRGAVLAEQNDFGSAIQDFEHALKIRVNSVDALESLALVYMQKNDFDKTLETADQIEEIGPDLVSPYLVRAAALSAQDDQKGAKTALDKATAIDADNCTLIGSRAYWSMANNDNLKALTEANRLVEICPRMPSAYTVLSAVYLADGNTERARQEAVKALGMDSKLAEGYLVLTHVYIAKEEWGTAIYNADKAAALDPFSAQVFLAKGQAELKDGQVGQAIEDLKKSLSLNNQTYTAYYFLALGYETIGDFENAAHNLEVLLDEGKNLNMDMIKDAEEHLTFDKSIPPAKNGQRTFADEKKGFTITTSQDWLPTLDKDQDYGQMVFFAVHNNDFGWATTGLILITDPSLAGLPLPYLAEAIQADLSNEWENYKLIKAGASIKTENLTGVVYTYERERIGLDGEVEKVVCKNYYFLKGNQLAVIVTEVNWNAFDDYEPIFDQIATTFGFSS